MIVVADTTPIRYLIVIGREHLLPALYGRVLIPPAVLKELTHQNAPDLVKVWMQNRPDWLDVKPALQTAVNEFLDPGEWEAILLAEELKADVILMDEWDGRLEAARRQLTVVGTLRVLADAAHLGLTDVEESFRLLRAAGFRVSDELLQRLVSEHKRIG